MNFRQRSVDVHQFSMIPRTDVPRSTFRRQHGYKTTFDAGYLIPFYLDEVLPGDTFNVNATLFARLATPIFPVMDNLYVETFFFFVPNRLVWSNWEKFMGEQINPADSISYVIPQQVCPAGGYAVGSLQDYMGLPTVGQVGGGNTVTHSALYLRAYNLIYNDWFRDENLQNSLTVDMGDGPDNVANYVLRRRGKRHDYFTSALPWPQKGGVAVTLPLGTSALVKTSASETFTGTQPVARYRPANGTATPAGAFQIGINTGALDWGAALANAGVGLYPTNLYADLSTATAATVNQLREAFQVQKFLERDARGGTRYAEIVRSHFGVISPDARLQRPEYLGGGSAPITVNPIAQTSATGLTGGSTPTGNLSAFGTGLARGHGFFLFGN